MMKADRLELAYDLIFSTPFHAGTGLRVGLIDRTIVRDHDDYLYVPGSTIKGVLRQHCEELARLYEDSDDRTRELIASPHNTQVTLWARGHFPTMVTRIFGSPNMPGTLFFDDARQTETEKLAYDSPGPYERRGNGRYKALQTELATQVRLDRPTRTAAPGALYTSEFGNKDIVLHGEISGWLQCFSIEDMEDRTPTYSLLLLLASLHLLQWLGGNKSTGKGHCCCQITNLRYGDAQVQPTQWEAWLDHLDTLSLYSYTATIEQEKQA